MADGDEKTVETTIEPLKDAKKGSHQPHPSIDNAQAYRRVSHYKDKFQEKITETKKKSTEEKPQLLGRRLTHEPKKPSVYVLDKAQLSKRGVDFWEYKKDVNDGVSESWWDQQLKLRKMLKEKHNSFTIDTIIENSQAKPTKVIVKNNNSISFDPDDDDGTNELVDNSDTTKMKNSDENEIKFEFQDLLQDYKKANDQLQVLMKENNENNSKMKSMEEKLKAMENNPNQDKLSDEINKLVTAINGLKQSDDITKKTLVDIQNKLTNVTKSNQEQTEIVKKEYHELKEKLVFNKEINQWNNSNNNTNNDDIKKLILMVEELKKKDEHTQKMLEDIQHKLHQVESEKQEHENKTCSKRIFHEKRMALWICML